MSYILSVYSTKAFKEHLMPAIDNADYSIIVQSDLFGLSGDVEIVMEIIDGQWKILPSDAYRFIYTVSKEKYEGVALKDGDVLTGTLSKGDPISIVVRETDSSFAVCKKYSLHSISEISIGKSPQNIFCYNNLNLISNEHAKIMVQGDHCVVADTSANGVFVNAKRIAGSCQLRFGDCIDIFGLRIVYFKDFIAVDTAVENLVIKETVLEEYIPDSAPLTTGRVRNSGGKRLFHRSPRNIAKIETERVEIEGPTAPKDLHVQPTFLAIGPSLTMALPMLMGCALSIYSTKVSGRSSGAFMYTGLITAVGSALVGSVWAILNMRQAKKRNREDELKRFEAYSEYLIKTSNEIKAKYENNTRALHSMYPAAEVLCRYNENSSELWNRNARHEDFLSYRLGLGSIPFQVPIDVPKEKFTLMNDSLADKPRMIKESYKMLHDVPVCIDLFAHKIIGVIGGDKKKGCYPVIHSLITQIAACNCYTDVKMVFLYDEAQDDAKDKWEFAKWLPHVWSEDKKTRYVAGNKNDASEVLFELTKTLRIRAEERENLHSKEEEISKPYYIFVLENPSYLEGELVTKYIQDDENNAGVTTIMMVAGYEDLPNTCEYIIENTPGYSGVYGVADGLEDRISVKYDLLSGIQLEHLARCLSGIEVREMETGGEIPNVLTFFDMYGVNRLEEFNVMERWKKNRTYDSIKALVGQKAGGANCYLDVHEKYHGPHGLVAGTTGSGKSETLQTYMLSLALNYSPDDIGFFVIDYKGGGMANLFDGLPHMIGQISNLSGNQVHRAMVSIKSENVRRQRIFNEHGVNNINLYTRLYKNNEASIPVPHMFIIIDEFAELKREEPDFMRELISVAQVGRSLGVHLILATQKPSGTVDDNIWSNSKFRLCLRVQDRQDSTDMLHRPDAAYITQAGRCYMQVGNDELFELFQSAWSGATYDENAGSVQTDIAKMLSSDGKAALIGSHAKIKQKEQAKYQWIQLLLQLLDESAKILGVNLVDCLYDNSLTDSITKQFFKEIDQRKIEYADSDYNVHRVQDLLTVYMTVLGKEEAGEEGIRDSYAQAVITQAILDGKKLPEMKEKTQLDAVVEYLARVAKENGYTHNLQLWLPVLPEMLYLEDLNGYKKHCFDGEKWQEPGKGFTLETLVGLYDDPVNQAQRPVTLDIAQNGNHAIIGTVTSGKSTFLMTYLYSLVNRYTPDAVNLYILDYSSKALGALEGLAHVGGVMFENDDEKVSKFFIMLEAILEERKKMFRGGSYSQYIQANGLTVPAVIVAIDNMAAFRNKTNGLYEDLMMTLLKEGAGYGIFFIVTAAGFGLSEIPTRMGDNFRTVICLEMNDKYAYTDALRTMHIDVLPEENVKGRGLAKIGEAILEFQTALTMPAEDDYKRGELVRERCARMNMAWHGKLARPIPEIPENPVWREYSVLEDVTGMFKSGDRLPIGYDKKNATIYGINLRKTYCYMISGKTRTGKTNTLRILTMSAHMVGGAIAVIDFTGDLKAVAENTGARYITDDKELFDFFMQISPTFKERNVKKKAYVADGLTDEEIFERMQEFEKQFIIIDDLPEFVKHVHNPIEGVNPMAPFVTTLLEKGAMHNVFWFAGFNQDDNAKATGLSVFNSFVKDRNGMHLGGNVAAQRSLNFDYISYAEQTKAQKPGIAMLPMHDEERTTMVVVPLYKTE